MPVTSLIATPIRRSPTSSAATRATSYNSRIPYVSSVPRCLAIALTCLALASGALGAQEPAASPESQARRVSDRIRSLQREAQRLATDAGTLVAELRKLEIDRDLKLEQAKESATARTEAERALQETTDRVSTLELQRLSQLPDMKVQLVDIYKRGRSGYARLLFGAGDMREFGRAARAVSALASLTEKRLEEHRRTLEALREERAGFAQKASELQAREAAAQQARVEADRAIAARAARMAQIDSRRDLTAQYVGELQVAYDKIQQQLAGTEGRSGGAVSVPLLPFQGALEWPTPGRVSTRFEPPSSRGGGSAVKNGVEIAGTEDAAVRAVHSGTVAFADAFTGLGTLVILDHGGNNYSLYGYLGTAKVAMGQVLETGGEVGRVGLSPGGPPALYFELRIDGKSVDPVQWLKPR